LTGTDTSRSGRPGSSRPPTRTAAATSPNLRVVDRIDSDDPNVFTVLVVEPALRDDALEAAIADGYEQRLAVLEPRHEPNPRPLHLELLEQRPSLRIRLRRRRQPLDREDSNSVTAIPGRVCSIRAASRWKSGRPSASSAASSPSSCTSAGSASASSGSSGVMFQPRPRPREITPERESITSADS
jgi:hypothetical protein